MLNSGVTRGEVTPLLNLARKAEKAELVEEVVTQKGKEQGRCKWWNRGYCREQDRCSCNQPTTDCVEHLQGGCTRRGCTSLRHRKVCKFLASEAGCLRGDTCEYLHPEKFEVMDKVNSDKNKTIEKEIQIESELQQHCMCKEIVEQNKLFFDRK